MVDKAEPLENKAIDGLVDLPQQVDRPVVLRRVVAAVRGGAQPDQAGRVSARVGDSRRSRATSQVTMDRAQVQPLESK